MIAVAETVPDWVAVAILIALGVPAGVWLTYQVARDFWNDS